MSLLRQLARGLRALTRPHAVAADVDDEVRDFFERARAELEADGFSAREAARVARLRLGDAGRAREDLHAFGWENTVERTLGDLRLSLRRLAREPGSAAVVVLTLALGIGASAAIVSAVYPILVAPLPYPRGDAIVMLSDRDARGADGALTHGTYVELAARSASFSALAVSDHWTPALAGGSEPERVDGELVSADYLRVLGVEPVVGRGFEASDDVFRGPRVAIVADSLARRRFGGTRAILGKPLVLDGVAHTVIGVMPDDFENVLAPTAEIWAPRQYRTDVPFDAPEWGRHMRMIGRLADGRSIEHARRELDTIAANAIDEFPRPTWAALETGFGVEPLKDAVTADLRPALLAILGAVLVLLVMASVNATNLLLARGARRTSELAVRAALGAGRARLARQLLTESLMLALLGGAAGLVVAALGVRLILALAPAGLPRAGAISLDVSTLVFAFALTLVVGVAVGLVPALRGAGTDLRADLASQARATVGSHHRLRRALVVAEVGLALLILSGAGLLFRSVEALLAATPGFDTERALTLQVVATGKAFDSNAAAGRYFESVVEAARGVPGVAGAALSSQLPLSGDADAYGSRPEADFEDAAGATASNDYVGAYRYAVTPDWFATMRIPLLRGRLLDAGDGPGTPPVAVISESLAQRWFGESDPIGQRIRFGPEITRTDEPARIVVGVVGDVKQTSLALAPPDAFYVPMGQWAWVDVVQSLVIRTHGDPETLIPSIRRAIWSVDAATPIVRVAALEDLVAASERQRRFVLWIFEAFGLAALGLAAIGLYGVIAGGVSERTREIGLRAALGATRAKILALVLRQGLALTGAGIVLGLVVAAAVTRGLTTLLFGVTALDPATFAGVIVLLAVVTVVACAFPAWQAARIDPTRALRSE